ncbi:MAG: energy transducer TonB [Calditrichaceae bacterium]|nr:energy transducer TonB [Calditrichaceae bacterium]MBN2708877.1 energy transducer TonB [Calditrichaceae bacterium]RQV97597.1 MAG: energy transducer TonB [Calditrichota bacterium]
MSLKKRGNSWKESYQKTLEVSFTIALILLITIFFSFQKHESKFEIPALEGITEIEVINIPRTDQIKKPPKPETPHIPIEADEDEITDAETIDYEQINTEYLAINTPPPPDPEDEKLYQFFEVSEKPEIIKQVKPVYPEMAQKANISGTVTVTVLIGKTGDVEDVKVYKDVMMLTDAAVQAAWQCKFKPARQHDKYVKVWMNVPFVFTLK